MDFASLKSKYENFSKPIIEIQVGEMSMTAGEKRKKSLGVSNVHIELTAGFEASVATYSIYNVYNYEKASFDVSSIKNFIMLGSVVRIYAGYELTVREVFRGIITKVNFVVEEDDMANITVTCMDVKAVMMANRYSRRLKASVYSEAVKEIFNQGVYQTLKDNEAISSFTIEPTPDAPAGGVAPAAGPQQENNTDRTVEMVAESDYEFIVKVAKKFNFEFFVMGGEVIFRPAKADQTEQIDLQSDSRISRLSVEYDMTGLVEQIEVRGLDVGKAKMVSETIKNGNKFSIGNKAKSLIAGSKKVYIDPTVSASDDAKNRARYLYEDMSFRYGSLDVEMVGIPDILPGRFITVNGIGDAVSNKFYVQTVKHNFSPDGRYSTTITGKADRQEDMSLLGMGGLL